ncbi:MAG: hypothetical protein NTY12_01630 [Candidatus Falkowbacteria bacterium]|nr:hypothetical protein [Candidatus Falkowbacteria bacterium]
MTQKKKRSQEKDLGFEMFFQVLGYAFVSLVISALVYLSSSWTLGKCAWLALGIFVCACIFIDVEIEVIHEAQPGGKTKKTIKRTYYLLGHAYEENEEELEEE